MNYQEFPIISQAGHAHPYFLLGHPYFLLGKQCIDGCFSIYALVGKFPNPLDSHPVWAARFIKTLMPACDRITKTMGLESIAAIKNRPGIVSCDRSFARSVVLSDLTFSVSSAACASSFSLCPFREFLHFGIFPSGTRCCKPDTCSPR